MFKQIRGVTRKILITSISLVMAFSSVVVIYAITWQATPAGEPIFGGFIPFLEKALVSTGASTDGRVKLAQDTDGVGTGTILANGGNIGIGTASPGAKLDVVGTTRSTNLQLTTSASSGYIITGDQNGNASWQPNNYRLKVTGLLENWGSYGHNCFVMENTTVKCVGYNGNGEMGLGANTNNFYFPKNIPISGVKKLVTNNLNVLALMNSGTVWALGGNNSNGELGLGHASVVYVPTQIPGLSGVMDIVTGGAYQISYGWAAFACALLSDKTVKCWGINPNGGLGVGDASARYSPTTVVGLSGVKKIVMNEGEHTGSVCALLESGSIKCWGWNGHYELGVGDGNARYYATTVKNITTATDIVMAGSYDYGTHACAILADKTVKCWGYNNTGQLGVGDTTYRNAPTTVPGLTNIKKVVINRGTAYSTYALTEDGRVYSFGYNSYGELGLGDTAVRYSPVLIPGLTGVTDLSSVGWSSIGSVCATLSDKTAKCWGYNNYGQLGVGDTSNRYSPTTVFGLKNVEKIEMYETFYSSRVWACALITDGSVKCWGYNGNGQLGQGDTTSYTVPVTVKNLNKD